MKRALAGVLVLIGLAVLVGAVILGVNLFAPEPEPEPTIPVTLQRPAAGEVRADHLPDGTPVWVIGHEDGSVDVLSGFDTHVPFNLGKLLWWCNSARALDNPHHGSKWDEFGVRIGGPAPTGLPSWEVATQGSRIVLGQRRPPPRPEARHVGPPEHEREWCLGSDADVVVHTFDGWDLWESPTAAIDAAPAGWILLEGELVADRLGGRVILCAIDDCADAAVATAVDVPEPDLEFGPLGVGRFIAQVRDEALLNLTRVVWLEED